MSLLPENTPIVEVNREDQQMICAFARHHMRYEYLQQQLEMIVKQEDTYKQTFDYLYDSEDTTMLLVGTGYWQEDADALAGFVEGRVKLQSQKREALEQQVEGVKKTLNKLKVVLDGRFGNAINLNYEKK